MAKKTAEQLIVELANAKTVVAGLSKSIGASLALCPLSENGDSHVGLLYRETTEDDRPYSSGERLLSIDEKREALEFGMEGYSVDYQCPHCLKAYDLIQERKQARTKAGRTMAAVTIRGKELMKGGNQCEPST